jgi:hypothetical protein
MDIQKTPVLSSGQMKTIGFLILIVVIIYALYVILERMGLIRTKAQKDMAAAKDKASMAATQAEKTIQNTTVLNPNYHLQPSVPEENLLSDMLADSLTDKLQSSMSKFLGIITSSVSEALAVIAQLTHKAQMSQIASLYNIKFGRSLSSDLSDWFTDNDLVRINAAIAAIPD